MSFFLYTINLLWLPNMIIIIKINELALFLLLSCSLIIYSIDQ